MVQYCHFAICNNFMSLAKKLKKKENQRKRKERRKRKTRSNTPAMYMILDKITRTTC